MASCWASVHGLGAPGTEGTTPALAAGNDDAAAAELGSMSDDSSLYEFVETDHAGNGARHR